MYRREEARDAGCFEVISPALGDGTEAFYRGCDQPLLCPLQSLSVPTPYWNRQKASCPRIHFERGEAREMVYELDSSADTTINSMIIQKHRNQPGQAIRTKTVSISKEIIRPPTPMPNLLELLESREKLLKRVQRYKYSLYGINRHGMSKKRFGLIGENLTRVTKQLGTHWKGHYANFNQYKLSKVAAARLFDQANLSLSNDMDSSWLIRRDPSLVLLSESLGRTSIKDESELHLENAMDKKRANNLFMDMYKDTDGLELNDPIHDESDECSATSEICLGYFMASDFYSTNTSVCELSDGTRSI